MEFEGWLSLQSRRIVNNFFDLILFFKFSFRISHYATTSNEESVYIIGGWDAASSGDSSLDIIAQYKDDAWFNIGNLAQRKYGLQAITFTHFSESITVIIGGDTNDGSGWVFQVRVQ